MKTTTQSLPNKSTTTKKVRVATQGSYTPGGFNLPAMKRADKRRADKALEYNKRDLRNMGIVCVLATALLYTSLWLVAVIAG